MSEGKVDCPTKCSSNETKLDYLYCQDKEMRIGRSKLVAILVNQLQCLHTYPGITVLLKQILVEGFTTRWWEDITLDILVDTMQKRVIEQQSKLEDSSVPKGYIIVGWLKVQQQWEIISNLPGSNSRWGKEVITGIHTYIYKSWKLRNDIVHGNTKKSQKAIDRQELQDKMVSLYIKGMANLNLKKRIISNFQWSCGLKRELNHFVCR